MDLSFNELANIADAPDDAKRIGLEDWKIHRTTEAISLRLSAAQGKELYIIAGKQLRSSERLEILAVGNDLPEAEVTPFCDLLNRCHTGESDRIIIIPWGFGKWTGRRRQLIEKTIETADPESLYFAENGNRLKFWPETSLLRLARNRGFRILSGSDPLPFKSQERKAGSHGFMISGDFDPHRPFQSIHQLLNQLAHSESIELFGRGQNLLKFLRNQVAMQFRRHFAQR